METEKIESSPKSKGINNISSDTCSLHHNNFRGWNQEILKWITTFIVWLFQEKVKTKGSCNWSRGAATWESLPTSSLSSLFLQSDSITHQITLEEREREDRIRRRRETEGKRRKETNPMKWRHKTNEGVKAAVSLNNNNNKNRKRKVPKYQRITCKRFSQKRDTNRKTTGINDSPSTTMFVPWIKVMQKVNMKKKLVMKRCGVIFEEFVIVTLFRMFWQTRCSGRCSGRSSSRCRNSLSGVILSGDVFFFMSWLYFFFLFFFVDFLDGQISSLNDSRWRQKCFSQTVRKKSETLAQNLVQNKTKVERSDRGWSLATHSRDRDVFYGKHSTQSLPGETVVSLPQSLLVYWTWIYFPGLFIDFLRSLLPSSSFKSVREEETLYRKLVCLLLL